MGFIVNGIAIAYEVFFSFSGQHVSIWKFLIDLLFSAKKIVKWVLNVVAYRVLLFSATKNSLLFSAKKNSKMSSQRSSLSSCTV
jgi:hypothetical protein